MFFVSIEVSRTSSLRWLVPWPRRLRGVSGLFWSWEGLGRLTSSDDGIRDWLSNIANGLLSRVKVGLATFLSTVGVGSSAVSELLGGRLLAVCVVVLDRPKKAATRHTRLDGTSNLISGTRDVLGCNLGVRFLGLRGDLLADLLTETLASVALSVCMYDNTRRGSLTRCQTSWVDLMVDLLICFDWGKFRNVVVWRKGGRGGKKMADNKESK